MGEYFPSGGSYATCPPDRKVIIYRSMGEIDPYSIYPPGFMGGYNSGNVVVLPNFFPHLNSPASSHMCTAPQDICTLQRMQRSYRVPLDHGSTCIKNAFIESSDDSTAASDEGINKGIKDLIKYPERYEEQVTAGSELHSQKASTSKDSPNKKLDGECSSGSEGIVVSEIKGTSGAGDSAHTETLGGNPTKEETKAQPQYPDVNPALKLKSKRKVQPSLQARAAYQGHPAYKKYGEYRNYYDNSTQYYCIQSKIAKIWKDPLPQHLQPQTMLNYGGFQYESTKTHRRKDVNFDILNQDSQYIKDKKINTRNEQEDIFALHPPFRTTRQTTCGVDKLRVDANRSTHPSANASKNFKDVERSGALKPSIRFSDNNVGLEEMPCYMRTSTGNSNKKDDLSLPYLKKETAHTITADRIGALSNSYMLMNKNIPAETSSCKEDATDTFDDKKSYHYQHNLAKHRDNATLDLRKKYKAVNWPEDNEDMLTKPANLTPEEVLLKDKLRFSSCAYTSNTLKFDRVNMMDELLHEKECMQEEHAYEQLPCQSGIMRGTTSAAKEEQIKSASKVMVGGEKVKIEVSDAAGSQDNECRYFDASNSCYQSANKLAGPCKISSSHFVGPPDPEKHNMALNTINSCTPAPISILKHFKPTEMLVPTDEYDFHEVSGASHKASLSSYSKSHTGLEKDLNNLCKSVSHKETKEMSTKAVDIVSELGSCAYGSQAAQLTKTAKRNSAVTLKGRVPNIERSSNQPNYILPNREGEAPLCSTSAGLATRRDESFWQPQENVPFNISRKLQQNNQNAAEGCKVMSDTHHARITLLHSYIEPKNGKNIKNQTTNCDKAFRARNIKSYIHKIPGDRAEGASKNSPTYANDFPQLQEFTKHSMPHVSAATSEDENKFDAYGGSLIQKKGIGNEHINFCFSSEYGGGMPVSGRYLSSGAESVCSEPLGIALKQNHLMPTLRMNDGNEASNITWSKERRKKILQRQENKIDGVLSVSTPQQDIGTPSKPLKQPLLSHKQSLESLEETSSDEGIFLTPRNSINVASNVCRGKLAGEWGKTFKSAHSIERCLSEQRPVSCNLRSGPASFNKINNYDRPNDAQNACLRNKDWSKSSQSSDNGDVGKSCKSSPIAMVKPSGAAWRGFPSHCEARIHARMQHGMKKQHLRMSSSCKEAPYLNSKSGLAKSGYESRQHSIEAATITERKSNNRGESRGSTGVRITLYQDAQHNHTANTLYSGSMSDHPEQFSTNNSISVTEKTHPLNLEKKSTMMPLHGLGAQNLVELSNRQQEELRDSALTPNNLSVQQQNENHNSLARLKQTSLENISDSKNLQSVLQQGKCKAKKTAANTDYDSEYRSTEVLDNCDHVYENAPIVKSARRVTMDLHSPYTSCSSSKSSLPEISGKMYAAQEGYYKRSPFERSSVRHLNTEKRSLIRRRAARITPKISSDECERAYQLNGMRLRTLPLRYKTEQREKSLLRIDDQSLEAKSPRNKESNNQSSFDNEATTNLCRLHKLERNSLARRTFEKSLGPSIFRKSFTADENDTVNPLQLRGILNVKNIFACKNNISLQAALSNPTNSEQASRDKHKKGSLTRLRSAPPIISLSTTQDHSCNARPTQKSANKILRHSRSISDLKLHSEDCYKGYQPKKCHDSLLIKEPFQLFTVTKRLVKKDNRMQSVLKYSKTSNDSPQQVESFGSENSKHENFEMLEGKNLRYPTSGLRLRSYQRDVQAEYRPILENVKSCSDHIGKPNSIAQVKGNFINDESSRDHSNNTLYDENFSLIKFTDKPSVSPKNTAKYHEFQTSCTKYGASEHQSKIACGADNASTENSNTSFEAYSKNAMFNTSPSSQRTNKPHRIQATAYEQKAEHLQVMEGLRETCEKLPSLTHTSKQQVREYSMGIEDDDTELARVADRKISSRRKTVAERHEKEASIQKRSDCCYITEHNLHTDSQLEWLQNNGLNKACNSKYACKGNGLFEKAEFSKKGQYAVTDLKPRNSTPCTSSDSKNEISEASTESDYLNNYGSTNDRKSFAKDLLSQSDKSSQNSSFAVFPLDTGSANSRLEAPAEFDAACESHTDSIISVKESPDDRWDKQVRRNAGAPCRTQLDEKKAPVDEQTNFAVLLEILEAEKELNDEMRKSNDKMPSKVSDGDAGLQNAPRMQCFPEQTKGTSLIIAASDDNVGTDALQEITAVKAGTRSDGRIHRFETANTPAEASSVVTNLASSQSENHFVPASATDSILLLKEDLEAKQNWSSLLSTKFQAASGSVVPHEQYDKSLESYPNHILDSRLTTNGSMTCRYQGVCNDNISGISTQETNCKQASSTSIPGLEFKKLIYGTQSTASRKYQQDFPVLHCRKFLEDFAPEESTLIRSIISNQDLHPKEARYESTGNCASTNLSLFPPNTEGIKGGRLGGSDFLTSLYSILAMPDPNSRKEKLATLKQLQALPYGTANRNKAQLVASPSPIHFMQCKNMGDRNKASMGSWVPQQSCNRYRIMHTSSFQKSCLLKEYTSCRPTFKSCALYKHKLAGHRILCESAPGASRLNISACYSGTEQTRGKQQESYLQP